MTEYREKLRSLTFVSRPTRSKTVQDRTDTAHVTTTVADDSQDVNIRMLNAVED